MNLKRDTDFNDGAGNKGENMADQRNESKGRGNPGRAPRRSDGSGYRPKSNTNRASNSGSTAGSGGAKPTGEYSARRSTGAKPTGEYSASRSTGAKPTGEYSSRRSTGAKPTGEYSARRSTGAKPTGEYSASRSTVRPSASSSPRRSGSDYKRPFDKAGSFSRKTDPVVTDKTPETGDAVPDDRLEGRNPVMEALRADRTINKIWVAATDGTHFDPALGRIVKMARDKNIPMVEVTRTILDKMSVTRIHQGVIAQIASHDYVDIDEFVEQVFEKKKAPFFLMLDSLKDSYNFGSILRIADAAGVDGVIIPKHRSIGLDATVAKASSGAIEYVPVARVTNLSRTIDDLKKRGFWIYGTDASAETSYDEAKFDGPILLIIGSEGEGVHETIIEKCDVTVSVPMEGHVNSLNAAVAAGIVVFEARRQRKKNDAIND